MQPRDTPSSDETTRVMLFDQWPDGEGFDEATDEHTTSRWLRSSALGIPVQRPAPFGFSEPPDMSEAWDDDDDETHQLQRDAAARSLGFLARAPSMDWDEDDSTTHTFDHHQVLMGLRSVAPPLDNDIVSARAHRSSLEDFAHEPEPSTDFARRQMASRARAAGGRSAPAVRPRVRLPEIQAGPGSSQAAQPPARRRPVSRTLPPLGIAPGHAGMFAAPEAPAPRRPAPQTLPPMPQTPLVEQFSRAPQTLPPMRTSSADRQRHVTPQTLPPMRTAPALFDEPGPQPVPRRPAPPSYAHTLQHDGTARRSSLPPLRTAPAQPQAFAYDMPELPEVAALTAPSLSAMQLVMASVLPGLALFLAVLAGRVLLSSGDDAQAAPKPAVVAPAYPSAPATPAPTQRRD